MMALQGERQSCHSASVWAGGLPPALGTHSNKCVHQIVRKTIKTSQDQKPHIVCAMCVWSSIHGSTPCWAGERGTGYGISGGISGARLGHDSAVSGMTGGVRRNPLLSGTSSIPGTALLSRLRSPNTYDENNRDLIQPILQALCAQGSINHEKVHLNCQLIEDLACNHCRAPPEIPQIKLQISDQLKLAQLSKNLFWKMLLLELLFKTSAEWKPPQPLWESLAWNTLSQR